MKYCICMLLAILCEYRSPAQDLLRIGVPLFDFQEQNNLNLANHVTEVVIDLLQKSGRYTVVDMTSEEQRQEALDRAQENYKAENWLDANSALNAELILGGEITSIKFVKSSSSTQPGYRAAITLTLKLIDVETGRITASDHFSSVKSELRLTPETALSSAIESIAGNILSFFEHHVKQEFPILKINVVKKDKVTEVTARIPQNLNIRKGEKFKLIHRETLGGQIVPSLIGEAIVKSFVSGDFYILEVKTGGDRLFALQDQLNQVSCSE